MKVPFQKHILAASLVLIAGSACAESSSVANPFGLLKKGAPIPAPTPTIVGGSTTNNDGSVVALYHTRTPFAYGGGIPNQLTDHVICTGTIIPGPVIPGAIVVQKYILTAKKCLPTATDPKNTNYKDFSVYFNAASSPNKVLTRASTGSISTAFGTVRYDVTDFYAIDDTLAILEVASNIRSSGPKAIVGGDPVYWQSLYNSSYGQTSLSAYTTYGGLRISSYAVTGVSNTAIQLTPTATYGAGYPCEGDLGSALYGLLGGKFQIFGVLSTITCGASGNITTPTNSIRTKTINEAMVPNYNAAVQQYYLAYFGRPADPGGLVNFANALQGSNAPKTIEGLYDAYNNNSTVRSLVDSFSSSPASDRLYPPGTFGINEIFIKDVYKNVSNRVATNLEVNNWLVALSSTTTPITKGRVALGIMVEVLKRQNPVELNTIGKKSKVAANFTATLISSNKQDVFSGDNHAAIARAMMASVKETTDVNVYQAKVNETVSSIN